MSTPRGRPRRHVAPCRFCQKQFKRHEHLERHERTHTREQPFLCFCGRRFSRRDLLTRHQRVSHAEEIGEHEALHASGAGETVDTTTAETTERDPYVADGSQSQGVATSGTEPWLGHDGPSRGESAGRTGLCEARNGAPTRDANVSPLYNATLGDSEPLVDSYTQELLLGMNGLECDFLWDDAQLQSSFPPFDIFNTAVLFPLADNSQRCCTASSSAQGNDTATASGSDLGHREPPAHSRQPPVSTSTESQTTFASRLPSMEPEKPEVIPAAAALGLEDPSGRQVPLVRRTETVRPWKVSSADYSQILKGSAELRDGLPDAFCLPSNHTLSRFLEGYFRGFYVHMPFLHCVTFSAAHVDLELLLSMAAVGALYRYEHIQGYRLYDAARSLITWRLSRKNNLVLQRLVTGDVTQGGYPGSLSRSADTDNMASDHGLAPAVGDGGKADLRTLQAMTVLLAIASWSHGDLTRDALPMSSQVAALARDLGISRPEEPSPPSTPWEQWVEHEERRRTLFVAYALLNLQCVAFDTPPLILNREVAINLPGCASTWESPNLAEWSKLRDKYVPAEPFRKKLDELLSGRPIHLGSALSSFGNYVLVHGLTQQIFLARNSSGVGGALSGDFVGKMESSLRVWQESWEATYESTTDPSSPKGPMGFNSTALLRMAYIRLNADLGPVRRLLGRDPEAVAEAFFAAERIVGAEDRSPRLDRAVLQCAHALSIPVRVGVAFVARTRPLSWSIQHALCNLECAFLLTRWLLLVSECVGGAGLGSLRGDEQRLVNLVGSLVRDTEFADSLDQAGSHAAQVRNLAVSTMRLWAQTFKGFQVFDIVHVVGEGLAMVAETLEKRASVGFTSTA